MSGLVQRLRARKFFFLNGAVWMMGTGSDADCTEAADEIELLNEELKQAGKRHIDLVHANEAARAEIERLTTAWMNPAGHMELRAEIERLRGCLTDIMPLMEGCDCIYSDRVEPLCPCKAARAALEEPKK